MVSNVVAGISCGNMELAGV